RRTLPAGLDDHGVPGLAHAGWRVSTGGFSKARLARMHGVMAGHVDRGSVPGLVTLVSRRGEVHVDAIGAASADGSDPIRRDTIFRISSMTKPITAAAARRPITLRDLLTFRMGFGVVMAPPGAY